jgi:peroxiredoxin
VTWSFVGLGVLAAAMLVYLATLGLRRAQPTWIFDAGVLFGAASVVGAHFARAHEPGWALVAAPVAALGWFAATRKELGLPRAELRIAPGARLPDVTLATTSGTPIQTSALSGPALFVLYRGWWCPYCVTQLRELDAEHDALRAAGLAVYAISVDRPEEQRDLEARMAGRVTFLSDERGALLDALGLRHVDGVPWYDRLLFGARRQDIALPAAILVDEAGVVRFARRARRIDERPSLDELLAAWKR